MITLHASPGEPMLGSAYVEDSPRVQVKVEYVEHALRCAARVRVAHFGYFKRLSRAADRFRDIRRADYAGQLARIDRGEGV